MRFVLDLDDLTIGAATENIRPIALKRVLNRLVEMPKGDEAVDTGHDARPLRLNVLERRPHSAILVTARRGDGKTTFLTHLLRLIEAGKGKYSGELGNEAPERIADLYSLGIIDPTLVESKQNIVVMIVDRMRDAVDRSAKANPTKSGEHEDVRRELRKLANGLSLLDGIGNEDLYGREWADPDYVLQQGLDRARSADEFERSLYTYISKACDFLRIDAFVLAIDDVDTAFDRGWPVLEALRKYLATDRLKVVLSGDLGLYNMLVRREQWRQVTHDFLKAERRLPPKYARTEKLAHLIEELQDQYLVKIAPTERRVELQPLNELVVDKGLLLLANGREQDPRSYTRAMGQAVVRATLPADQDAFASAIFRLPLRSAVRILQSGVHAASPSSAGDPRAPYPVMRQVLSSVLLSRGIDAASLVDSDPRRVMHVLSNWLTATSRWGSGARFTAGTGDDDYDLVAIFVAAALVRIFHGRSSAMLEFGLRMCIVREKVEREALDEQTQKTLILHLWPTALEGATRFVSRLAAWDLASPGALGGNRDRTIRLSGVQVPVTSILWDVAFRKLYGMSFTASGGSYVQLDRSRFASILTGDDDSERQNLVQALPVPIRMFHESLRDQDSGIYGIGNDAYYRYANSLETLRSGLRSGASGILMLGACRIADGGRPEVGIFSVLRLIATVAELAGMGEAADGVSDAAARIESLLNEAELFRSYPSSGRAGTPVAPEGQSGLDEIEEHVPGETPLRRGGPARNRRQEFTRLMIRWLDQRRDVDAVMSPQTISRIWTRFTYAFDGIRSDLTEGRTLYLGVLVHRSIIAFLHAVGVEALRTTSRPIGTVAYRNPVSSAQPFHRLLNSIYDEDEVSPLQVPELAFFDHVFSCPLWGYFLARRDRDMIEGGRIDYTAQIVARYFERLNSRAEADGSDHDDPHPVEAGARPFDERNFLVAYGHPLAASGSTIFSGLYALLNTVPIDGGSRPATANDQLSGLVGTRAATPRPRPRRRAAGDESSAP